jgi:hypothetical protein
MTSFLVILRKAGKDKRRFFILSYVFVQAQTTDSLRLFMMIEKNLTQNK